MILPRPVALFILLYIIQAASFSEHLLAQTTIKGTIYDLLTGETLIGANVVLKGTTTGSQSGLDGTFEIKTDKPYPIDVSVSYIGYVSQDVTVKDSLPIKIILKANKISLQSVDVTGSRISEKQKESALTIESMDIIAVKETPAVSFYDGLGQLTGVDLTAASIGFKIVNTRGFNSTSPVRSLQIIDGVDNASPGLNFSLGNFLGASELDISKVDLVVGASSAFYGPNAFNGVISMSTRSPFAAPGLEVSIKTGTNSLLENAVRFAQIVKNRKGEEKFAYKFNLYYLKVNDWEANNFSATPQSKSNESNPGGYDAVNVYGDEYLTGFDQSQNPGSYPGFGVIARKGYKESDLVDYNTENLKAGLALHYKITENTELIYAFNFGTGTTIYQGDNRYSLKDIKFYQNRVELRHKDKWFIRAYSTQEDAGKSYDAFFTALLLQNAAKSNGDWYQDYVNYWTSQVKNPLQNLPGYPQPPVWPYTPEEYQAYLSSINPFLAANYNDTLVYYHGLTQAYANGIGNPINQNVPYLEPGTEAFDTAFAGITSRLTFGQGGSRFYDRSALYHIHGEYKFTPKIMDITVGGNFRLYTPNSAGTIFSDTSGVKITNKEGGVYAGIEKRLANQKLKLNFTIRADKNENFDLLISPAASAVYNINAKNIVRASLSSAIRNPTLSDQYLYYQVGRAILIGNKDGYHNLVTIPSLQAFVDAPFQNFNTLEYFDVKAVRPEEVKTVELGYRATLSERLYVDVGGYYSWYDNFIGYKIGADIDTFTVTIPGLPPYKTWAFNNVLRVATNSADQVTTNGVSVSLNYYVGNNYAITTNYSWNTLDRHGSEDPLIPAFNTPEHKYNIGFSGRDLRQFSFNVNYKWVDGFKYEGSPQFTGYIDSYGSLDAQVSYKVNQEKLIFKLGCSNVLNNEHYEVYGGPLVGRLTYFSIFIKTADL